MRVFIVGAGLIGARIVNALHADHELTVVDIDPARVRPLAQQFDVATAQASATSGRDLLRAGIGSADLVISCTSRDEANLVAGSLARTLSPGAKTIIRTSSPEYVEIWREGRLDADGVVSTELETAHAVAAAVGMPAARQTDSFADGQVQIVELDVPPGAALASTPLRSLELPADSRVAGIIRDRRAILLRGDAQIEPGDRIVILASPAAAREWCRLISTRLGEVRDVVVFGAQELGAAIARTLCERELRVRVIESDRLLAEQIAERLPQARVFHTTGLDPGFMEREGIARMQAAVFAMRDDTKNLYAATMARVAGVSYRIALAHEAITPDVYDEAGIEVTVDPLAVTSEEIVRFAHDPRTHQMAMLEHDRFVVLDLTTRADSELVGVPLRELPQRGAVIGAVVRDGKARFLHADDALAAGDRVIVFTESERAGEVERAL